MVNGDRISSSRCRAGHHKPTSVFATIRSLLNVCQRVVSQIGRRVDSQPICDARLPDGSRVNVDCAAACRRWHLAHNREFQESKLTLDQLIEDQMISPAGAEILRVIW